MLSHFPRTHRSVCLVLSLFVAASAVTRSQGAAAAQTTVPNRIAQSADWEHLQPVANHVPLWATAANSTGPASGEVTATVVLARSPRQQAALDQLLADQQNPASPEFHHWLTPAVFGQRFGLSDDDLQAVKTWLERQGVRVTFVAPGRNFVGFAGPAAVVGRTFGTELRNYSVNGVQRMSVASAPLIPAAIAPVVQAIHGLYTIDEQPMHLATEPQTAGPDLTLSNNTNFIAPGDFARIYSLWSPVSGNQQTIGIVGRSRTNAADFSSFMYVTKQYFQSPTEIVPTAFGGVDPGAAWTTAPPTGVSLGEQSEATLDVTRAGSIATSAKLLLVVSTAQSGGIGTDMQYLVQTSPVPVQVVNISYGACESAAGQAGVAFWNGLFQQAAAEGISVFVSSGDSGASGCEQAFTSASLNPPPISPNFICSSSYATCVGGTELNDFNSSQYWGPNTNGLTSAQGYIPEGGWNEPTTSSGAFHVAGSGGGVSTFIPTPSWQTGTGVPAARTGRYTPDISFTAACHDAYFMCMAASGASCVPDSTGSFYFVGMCGTSASAPSMAGVAALLNDWMKYPQGNLNPALYSMAQKQPSVFHDTTPASSGVATCDIHTPSLCNNSTPSATSLTGGQDGYPLTVGYDMVTGLGSLNLENFLSGFATALPQPAVTLTPSVTSMHADQDLTISIAVGPPQGMPVPTGSVVLTAQTYNSGSIALSNGAATVIIPAGSLSGAGAGIDSVTITAQYTPDLASTGTYSGAKGTCIVTVSLIQPTITMTLSPASPTTAQDVVATVTVAGGSSDPVPTGLVSVSGGSYSGSAALASGKVAVTIPAGTMAPSLNVVSAWYSPDSTALRVYTGASINTTVTVIAAPKTTPTVSAIISPASPTITDIISISIHVTPASGTPAPTGSVQINAGSTLLNTLPLLNGSATMTLSPGTIPSGATTIGVTYLGDYNNNAVTFTQPLTVSKAKSTLGFTVLGAGTIIADQSLAIQIGLTQQSGLPQPTGTITLSEGSYTSPATALANGFTSITIPSGNLPAGNDTITATYSGDTYYAAATGTTTITVAPTPPSIMVTGKDVTLTAGATSGNTSAITLTPSGGFTGSVSLTASLSQSPSGAQNLPTLSFGSTSPVNITGSTAGAATLTITTTAPYTSQLQKPFYLPAGTALALVIFFGIPARRRKLRAFLTAILLLSFISAGISACGGGSGGSSSTPAPTLHPGTTPGTYTVSITATSGAITNNSTIKLTVN